MQSSHDESWHEQVLPATLSRHHAARTKWAVNITVVRAAVRFKCRASQRRPGDRAQPLLGEEEAGDSRAETHGSPLLGTWMDTSVTKNYSECFRISQENDVIGYTEVAHNGQIYHAIMQCQGEWMVATLETRSVRLQLKGVDTVTLEYKPKDSEIWITSVAGRVPEITNPGVPKQRVLTSRQSVALLLMILLAMMDGLFFLIWAPGNWSRFYNGDDEWSPVPTAVMECPMPPPQPFYLEAGGAVVRTFVTSTVLNVQPVQSWADEYPRKESQKDLIKYHGARCYLVYQIVILPASLCLLYLHYLERSWDVTCLAAMFTNSPYILNALVTLAQYAIGQLYVRRMKIWARGAKHRIVRWQSGRSGVMERKQQYLWILALLNAFLVGLPTLAMIVAYIIPAIMQPLFLIQFILVLLSGGIISWLLGVGDFLKFAAGNPGRGEYLRREQYMTMRYLCNDVGSFSLAGDDLAAAQKVTDRVAEAIEREANAARSQWTYAALYFMPMFVSLRVALEVVFFETMHTYAGLSPWEATQVTWSERRVRLVVASLAVATQATLWHCWSGLQFLVEWL